MTQPRRASLSADTSWFLITTGTVGIFAALPLLWNIRFYFQDDTENGAFGVWFHLGESLLQGKIPVLNPSVWSSGNYLAEGQWGTWNPVIMAIGISAFLSANSVIFATVLKVGLLVLAGGGTYLLARSFSARPELAFVGGTAVSLNGFTMYFDAPSWVTGLLVWAFLPYFWLGLRVMALRATTPVWAFVVGYLIVTVGYVQGTLAVGFVLLAVGIDCLVRRYWGGVLRVAGVGVALVLVAVTVFLPGALTGSVTNRAVSIVGNDGMMGADIGGLVSSTIATGYPQVASWWWTGPTATSPMMYIAWFLPLLAFVDRKRAMALFSEWRDLSIFGALALLYVFLPTVIGPLRYPIRFMPYVALVLVVLTVVLVSRASRPRPSQRRLLIAVAAIAGGMYLAWGQLPSIILPILSAGAITLLAITVLWAVLRHSGILGNQPPWARVAAIIALTSLVLTGIQHSNTPSSPLYRSNTPAQTSIAKNVLAGVDGDVIVVGDPLDYKASPDAWNETLMANMWYLSPASVQNRYQLIGFAEYNAALCLRYLGGTCPELVEELFETQDDTGLTLVDQLSIDNIQILKGSVRKLRWANPPTGWSIADDNDIAVLWTRDEPVGPAGGVVWASPGTEVNEIDRTDTSVSFSVTGVPAGGGRVALSRLAWPGYSADGARVSDTPIDRYLLTVDLPGDAAGSTVTVAFAPPGWPIEVASWLISVLGVLAWSLALVVLNRRRTRSRPRSVAPGTGEDRGAKRASGPVPQPDRLL